MKKFIEAHPLVSVATVGAIIALIGFILTTHDPAQTLMYSGMCISFLSGCIFFRVFRRINSITNSRKK